jgi:hypothetical protein
MLLPVFLFIPSLYSMQNWIESGFFGYWKDAQSRITKALYQPAFADSSPSAVKYPEALLPWQSGEQAVRRSLELQANWVEKWIHRSGQESINLQIFSDLTGQINLAMEQWNHRQGELWKQWFTALEQSFNDTTAAGPHKSQVETWRRLVSESQSDLTHWLTKWEEQINCKPLVPGSLGCLTEKLGQEMLGWIENQAVLWQFALRTEWAARRQEPIATHATRA